jgi:hypothetical protein
MWFPTTTIPTLEICGTHNELCAFGTKIPFSHISANSLRCCRMSHFIRVVAICQKDYSPYWNMVVKKLSILEVYG